MEVWWEAWNISTEETWAGVVKMEVIVPMLWGWSFLPGYELQEGAALGNAVVRKTSRTREDQIPQRAAVEDGWAEHEACWELKVKSSLDGQSRGRV